MRRSLGHVLEEYFSLQSLKWRLESWRTARPFAEVVLSHRLVYRVEQVFLIHKPDGLLLYHIASPSVIAKHPDVISGMLMALSMFAQDAFGGEADTVDSLRVGELSVWIEQGSRALLAAVINGAAPETLRHVFSEALDSIHLEQSDALESFENVELSEVFKPYLESCLQAEYKSGG